MGRLKISTALCRTKVKQCTGFYKHPEKRNAYCALGAIFHEIYGWKGDKEWRKHNGCSVELQFIEDYDFVEDDQLSKIVIMNDRLLMTFKEICEKLKEQGL